jgi:CO/xanthine dehydrogenase FAD-binding subunit
MITEYHRPTTLEETLKLIGRAKPRTFPLGGGSVLNQPQSDSFAVVDLQALGLNQIQMKGNWLEVGATATLLTLLETDLPYDLQTIINIEAAHNLRQVATLAGTIVAWDGRSPLVTALLALDAKLTLQPGNEEVTVGNLLPLRQEQLKGKLITLISLPLQVQFAFHSVARTPVDRPIVCAALAQWRSGRTRLALGGFGHAPRLAMDGNEPIGLEPAAHNACAEATDEWASAEYRRETAAILAKRCLQDVQA